MAEGLAQEKIQKAKGGEERTKKKKEVIFLTSLILFFKGQLLSCPLWEKNIRLLNSRTILRLF